VGLPLFALGLALLAGYLRGGATTDGFWTGLLAAVVATTVLVAGLFVLNWRLQRYGSAFTCVLIAAALITCVVGAMMGIDQWVLVWSGERTTCTVNGVTDRVLATDDTVRIVHDHHLTCDGGVADLVTAPDVLAQPGRLLDITYARSGTFLPRATQDLAGWQTSAWFAGAGFVVALVVGVAEALAEE
jgi:hypothetical protein